MLAKLQRFFFKNKSGPSRSAVSIASAGGPSRNRYAQGAADRLAPLDFLIGTRPNRPSEKSRNCTGFTFVELLVVLTIIGILTTIGIASYNSFNEQRLLDKTAYELKNQLRLARSRAINGEKDCQTCGGAGVDGNCGTPDDIGGTIALDGWYANFNTNQMYGSCAGSPFGQKTLVELPTGVSIIVTGVSGNNLQFKPLGQGTNLTGSATVQFNGFDKTSEITIDASGEVE